MSSNDGSDMQYEAMMELIGDEMSVMGLGRVLLRELRRNPDIIDDVRFEYTALQMASRTGQKEIVKFLLEKGANVHKKGIGRFAPIHLACMSGSCEVVEMLLAYGADVHDRESLYHATPLNLAVLKDDVEIVQVLLAHGANPDDRDFPANHSLHRACTMGYYDIVKVLLDYGASLSAFDASGYTPLHYACKGSYLFYDNSEKSVPMVTLLLENGADPNQPDRNGRYILENLRFYVAVGEIVCDDVLANWQERLRPLLEILLDYGAGAGVPCLSKDDHHLECNTSLLMCCYQTFRREATRNSPARDNWEYEDVRDSFEGHFIKMSAAGLKSEEQKPFDPPEKNLDWSNSRREAYRLQCDAEIRRMKTQTIGNTTATYFNILTRNIPALEEQEILGKVTREGCKKRYPIYGHMIHSRYIKIKRHILVMKSLEFFSILSPSLLPDCAELVMGYLPNRELSKLVAVCRAYEAFMKKKSN